MNISTYGSLIFPVREYQADYSKRWKSTYEIYSPVLKNIFSLVMSKSYYIQHLKDDDVISSLYTDDVDIVTGSYIVRGFNIKMWRVRYNVGSSSNTRYRYIIDKNGEYTDIYIYLK